MTTFIVKRDPRVVSAGRARATIKIAQIRAAHAELPSADLTARVEELESTVAGLRDQLTEAHERVDFAERLLAEARQGRIRS